MLAARPPTDKRASHPGALSDDASSPISASGTYQIVHGDAAHADSSARSSADFDDAAPSRRAAIPLPLSPDLASAPTLRSGDDAPDGTQSRERPWLIEDPSEPTSLPAIHEPTPMIIDVETSSEAGLRYTRTFEIPHGSIPSKALTPPSRHRRDHYTAAHLAQGQASYSPQTRYAYA